MRPGERIGPYEVVGILGRGGMGVVYEVRHADVPRRLALKLIDPAGADADALLRFQREGEALARVRHPGVVSVHSAGRVDRGPPYLVMDLVEGTPLPSGPLEPRRAARLVRDLADAVAALHAAGVVHRDLKPSNVLLAADDRPVLLDLGLARALDASRLTATGTVLGTPAFMAPEQAQGLPADARADVYGLGAVLYALLTGQPPFSTQAGAGAIALLYAVVDRDPPWPRALNPAVPEALDEVVRRAMAKDPAARLPSAEALRDALDAWLVGATGTQRRSRAATILTVAAVTSVVGVLALAAIGRSLPPSPPPAQPVDPSSTPAAAPDPAVPDDPHRIADPGVGAGAAVWARFVDEHLLVVHGRGATWVALWDLGGEGPRLRDREELSSASSVVGAARGFGVRRVLVDVDGVPTLKTVSEGIGSTPRLRDGYRLHLPPGDASTTSALATGYAEYDAVARDRHVTVFRAGSPHVGHTLHDPVVALAFSGLSRVLAASTDGQLSTLTACSTRDHGETRDVVSAVAGRAAALAASPDALLRFALALDRGDDGHAILIGAVEGATGVTALAAPGDPAHARGPVALTFVRERDLLASVGPGALHVWRADGTERVATAAYADHHPRSLDASTRGDWLAAACEEGDVHLWSLAELVPVEGAESGASYTPSAPVDELVVTDVVGPRRVATSARFVSPDHLLVHGEDVPELALWAVPTTRPPRPEASARLPGGRRAGPIALREVDGATRAYVDRGDAVHEVEVDLGGPALRVSPTPTVRRADDAVGCVAEAPGMVALAGPGDDVVVLQGADRHVLRAPPGGVGALGVRGRSLVGVARAGRSYDVWHLPISTAVSSHPAPWVVHAVTGDAEARFSRTVLGGEDAAGHGQLLVQIRLEGKLLGLDVRDPAERQPWSHAAPVRGVISRRSRDEYVVVSIASDGPDDLRYWVFDTDRDWRVRAIGVAPPHRLVTIAASPDWTRLVAGCANGDVHVWRTADLAPP